MCWKNRLRFLYCNCLWSILTCSLSWRSEAKKFPIGVVLDIDNGELYNAYTLAIQELTKTTEGEEFSLVPEIELISGRGDWCQTAHIIERLICQNGVLALSTAILKENHLNEFFTISQRYHIPVVAPWIPIPSHHINSLDYSITPMNTQDAILDMISYYDYKKFIYLYSGYDGIHRLQAFYDALSFEKESIEIVFAKSFTTTTQFNAILHHVEKASRWAFKFIVLDCPIPLAKEALLNHVRDHSLGRRTYHYLVAGFAFDETWDQKVRNEISSLNVTGFRMIDSTRKSVKEYSKKWSAHNLPQSYHTEYDLNTNAAIVHDSLLVLKTSILQLAVKQPILMGRIFHPACNSNTTTTAEFTKSMGALTVLEKEIQNVHVEGLTGSIEFTPDGTRTNFTLNVMEIKVNGSLIKVGDWKEGVGYTAYGKQHEMIKPFICATVLEAPFMMLKKVKEGELEPSGNDRFEGFFKDFADALAQALNITLIIQESDTYGTRNKSLAGGWTGMMGQLVRNEADIGIGGLTANAARESAVQLSKSVIFMGISIMLYKPEKTWQQDIFAFMKPLSQGTWICIGLAYLGVSFVLFLIAKFNAKELHPTQKQGVTKLKPQFSISNSLWFTFASLVGQGTDLCPRSIAARLVGSVWWFLILIVTSSYTANFAAIQTVNRMEVSINSAADLAAQTEVKYGYMDGGATADFFRKSKIADYTKMADFIDSQRGVKTKTVEEGIERVRQEKGKYAFLLESLKNKYVNNNPPCNTIKVGDNLDTKGYVIGLSPNSPISMAKVNTVILDLRESGKISDFEEKWFASQCGIAKKKAQDAGRLPLETLIGVFYILIIGLLLALLIQLFEFWYESSKKCRKVNT